LWVGFPPEHFDSPLHNVIGVPSQFRRYRDFLRPFICSCLAVVLPFLVKSQLSCGFNGRRTDAGIADGRSMSRAKMRRPDGRRSFDISRHRF
jgi:hypothetical protein